METKFTAEEKLTEEEVDNFLLENPTFVRSWLSKRGLGDLGEDLYNQRLKEEAVDAFIDFLQNILFQKRMSQRIQTETLTANEMFKEIVKILNSQLQIDFVCHKVLQNLCILLKCEKANLFIVRGVGNVQYLISTLFHVTPESTLEESLHTEENALRIPFGKGISGFVAESKCLLNVKDAHQDPRFLIDLDEKTGFRTKSILCVPILDKGDNLLGVAQIMNKKEDSCFDSEDEMICESFLSFCAISIRNDNFLRRSFREYRHHQLLLKLNRCILENQNSQTKLISEITKLAMEMLQCESISIYLSDPKRDSIYPTKSSKVFQLLKGASDISEEIITPKVKTAIEQNINSGNISDVFLSKEFIEDDKIKLESKIESRLLCLAIKDVSKNFLGWMVYIKNSRDIFCNNDISMMEIFSMFCGLAIYNCRLYETAARMLNQLEFTNKILSYYTTCKPETVDYFLSMEVLNSNYYQIYQFDFNDFLYSEDDTVLLIVRIFLDSKTLPILNISMELLYRWILTVKKNYRPIIYHNWRHAVNVTQMMFCMLTTGKLQIYFTEFERICLLMASLCHDLDHRGYNNAFQAKTASPLATLYSTSVLENHHIDRSIMILKNEDTNIFQNISAENYQQGLKLIEKAILATDLVIYFERRNVFKRKLEVDDQTLSSQESIDLLISMMMTASDLSAITKPWDVQRKTAVMVAAEFFEQGDIETQCKYNVLPMMDRRKRHELPKMQVGFIDFVCTLVYKLLHQVREELKPLYDGMLENRAHWSDIANGQEQFDVDREFQLVLYNISLESAIRVGDQFQTNETSVSTQTVLTFDRKQKGVQTDISIPTDICQSEIKANCTTLSVNTVETKTVDSQTEHRTLEVSSARIQTERPSLRESEHLAIIMPHEQPVLNLDTSEESDIEQGKVLLQRKAHSSHAQPTQVMPLINRPRRNSWINTAVEDKRSELSHNRRGSQALNALPEETTDSFGRINRVFQPPVRQKQSSLESEFSKILESDETIISDVNTQIPVDHQETEAQGVTEKQKSAKESENIEGGKPQIDSKITESMRNPDCRKRKCAKIISRPDSKQKLKKFNAFRTKMCMIS